MIKQLIIKFFNVLNTLRIRLSPDYYRLLFWLKGVSFGKNMRILGKISIVNLGKITIGENFLMTSGNSVNPICSNIQGCFYTEPGARITIGDNVGMSSTRMWIKESLTIGCNVKIGGNVLLIDTDCHPMDYEVRRFSNEGTKSSPIKIEDDVWIGAHCIVLKGVTIGARSIIGAGSVVTKSIPADCIAVGNPAKVIRHI